MSTLSQIIYNLKNSQNKGTHTDDLKLSDRQLEFIINHFRAALAGQRANNKKSLDGFYQGMEEVKLQKTSDFRPYNEYAKVMRSIKRLPSIATSNNYGYLVKHVGARDEFMGYQQSSVSDFNIDLEHPFVKNIYFTNDNYLYIATKDNKFLREIFIKAVFNNPREAKFNDNPTEFLDFNWEYPISEGLINQLNNLIMNAEYQWMHILPSDLVNDGKDAKQQGN